MASLPEEGEKIMCDMKSSFRTAESLNRIKVKCPYCQRISTIEPGWTSADCPVCGGTFSIKAVRV